jgi:hypothetical protein
VTEANGLRFDAVRENDSDARERIVVELAEGRAGELAPGEDLAVERDALLVTNIE